MSSGLRVASLWRNKLQVQASVIASNLNFSKPLLPALIIVLNSCIPHSCLNSYAYLDGDSFLLHYKALVRPHLEYANQVWSPHLKKDIFAIENVQWRATKMLPGMRHLTCEQRLRKLRLPTLHYRRLWGDMIEMYKILNGKYDPQVADFIPFNRSETRGHNLKIVKQHTCLNTRKFAFIHRSANIWNSLPADVV